MPSIRSLLLVGLQSMYVVTAQSQPEPSENNLDFSDVSDISEFKQLLDLLPSESLHAALHGHLGPQYQDGIFEADNRAMEQIHNENPTLASRLVQIAKHDVAVKAELKKRQSTNDTVTSVSSPAVASSTTVPVIVSDSSTTAISFTTQPVVSSSSPSDPPSSTPSQDSATSTSAPTSEGSSQVSSASEQGSSIPPTTVAITTTNSQGSTVESSVVVSSAISRSGAGPVTTTDSAGSTITSSATSISAGTLSAAPRSSSVEVDGVLIPVPITSTDASGNPVTTTANAFQGSASVSVEQTFTTTNSRGDTITTSSRFPGVVVTDSQGSVTTSPVASVRVGNGGSIITEAPVPSPSGGASSDAPDVTTTDDSGNTVVLSDAVLGRVITATDARGSTFITTYTPGGGAVSSLVLHTVTAANGQHSTVTSFALVGGAQATSASDSPGPASRTATSSPGLQTGAAHATRGYAKEVVALIGGAIGVAYLL